MDICSANPTSSHLEKKCSFCGIRYFQDYLYGSGLFSCEHCYTAFPETFADREARRERKCNEKDPLYSYLPSKNASVRTRHLLHFFKSAAASPLSNAVTSSMLPLASISKGKSNREYCFVAAKDSSGEILSLRLRFARNLAGIRYLSQLNENEKLFIRDIFQSPTSIFFQTFQEIHAKLEKKGISIRSYHNDEDHVRTEWIFPAYPVNNEGSFTKRQLQIIQEKLSLCLEGQEKLDALYQWQFHKKYGYLTSCPTLYGVGLRFSIKMYLTNIRVYSILSTRGRKDDAIWRESFKSLGYEVRNISPMKGPQLQNLSDFTMNKACALADIESKADTEEKCEEQFVTLEFSCYEFPFSLNEAPHASKVNILMKEMKDMNILLAKYVAARQ